MTYATEFRLLDGQIAGVRIGSGPKKILAFHGYLDNAHSFLPLARELHEEVEIWSVDLPGHGHSKRLPALEGSFLLSWLPVLGQVLDDLGWEQVPILGHSLGAISAQFLAAIDERVTALYCLDALGPIASGTKENFSRYKRVYQSRGNALPVRYYPSFSVLVEARRKGMFPLSEDAAKVMSQRAVGVSAQGWFHRYDRLLRKESMWRLSEEEIQYWLEQIACPVHLAMFSLNNFQDHQLVYDQRLEKLPQAYVTQIHGTHHEHLESPASIAQWLREALAKGK